MTSTAEGWLSGFKDGVFFAGPDAGLSLICAIGSSNSTPMTFPYFFGDGKNQPNFVGVYRAPL